MRAYIAVLTDSLREARASRMLWIVLGAITLALAAAFPLRFAETAVVELHPREVLNWKEFAEVLLQAKGENSKSPAIAKLLRERFDDELEQSLRTLADTTRPGGKRRDGFAAAVNEGGAMERTVRAVNRQLRDENWCESLLDHVRLGREASELARKRREGKDFSSADARRLNRLVLEDGLPQYIQASPLTSVSLAYAWWDSEQPIPGSREQVKAMVPVVCALVIDYVFGTAGILVALLVTASIIPQMFEPGSLHLLLSKPISRSLFFLTKFSGACAFVAVSAAYFFTGAWLFLGVRFDVWDSRLLYGIPIYVFVFAIYYSVAALVGLLFRNTILAICAGLLFWLFCFVLGISHNMLEAITVLPSRVVKIVPAGEQLLSVTQSGEVREWNAEQRIWQTCYVAGAENRNPFARSTPAIGPIYLPESGRIASVQRNFRRDLDDSLSFADAVPGRPRKKGAELPSGTTSLVEVEEGKFIAAAYDGLYLNRRDLFAGSDRPAMFGIALPWSQDSAFEKIELDGEWRFNVRPVLAYDPHAQLLAVYSSGKLGIYEPRDKGYRLRCSIEREARDGTRSPLMEFTGTSLLTAWSDGVWESRSTIDLEVEASSRGEGTIAPMRLHVSPSRKIVAAVYPTGTLRLWNGETADWVVPRIPSQGAITAAVFTSDDELLLATQANRVYRWSLTTGNRTLEAAPNRELQESVYRWFVQPLYRVCPKPGELYKTMLALLIGKSTAESPDGRDAYESGEGVVELNPWRPIGSGIAFMVIMLGIGCLYFERREF